MAIYIAGSMCFDRIMTFPGNFREHILEDKLHILNVSFMVDRMEEKRGGCAGNIAYTLALLAERPLVLAAVGKDFDSYAAFMLDCDLPLDGLRHCPDLFTGLCYITTDMRGNQLTGFYPGAMSMPCGYTFPNLKPQEDIAIVSPGNVDDMRSLPRFYRERGVRYIYDPGQQIPVLSGEDMLDALTGAYALTSNDYELDMICKHTGKSRTELLQHVQHIITTYGEKGCSVTGASLQGEQVHVHAVPVAKVVDPTGAGDAHRAGILKGLTCGFDLPDAVRLGATCASFAIEHYGTQQHSFDKAAFVARHETAFGKLPQPLF